MIGQCTFKSDFRILDLQSFDVIVGMDWLSAFSPKHIHWEQKWLAIPYNGQFVILEGMNTQRPASLYLQVCQLSADNAKEEAPAQLPPEIVALVSQFHHLFEPPTSLPPSWACNHTIPLIPGARPIFIWPYRHPPGLKDEIEKQVSDMLQQGPIQPSTSSFSSPVLLVKKKDDSYRFCVDFCHLNALTAKSKFPVLVFDQLMDEFSQSS
jgi:hypothetical protein